MRGALLFGLIAGIVAGVTMAVTLQTGHYLGRAWWLPLASAGAAAVVGVLLGAVTHLLTRSS
jgi:hypothetical protein